MACNDGVRSPAERRYKWNASKCTEPIDGVPAHRRESLCAAQPLENAPPLQRRTFGTEDDKDGLVFAPLPRVSRVALRTIEEEFLELSDWKCLAAPAAGGDRQPRPPPPTAPRMGFRHSLAAVQTEHAAPAAGGDRQPRPPPPTAPRRGFRQSLAAVQTEQTKDFQKVCDWKCPAAPAAGGDRQPCPPPPTAPRLGFRRSFAAVQTEQTKDFLKLCDWNCPAPPAAGIDREPGPPPTTAPRRGCRQRFAPVQTEQIKEETHGPATEEGTDPKHPFDVTAQASTPVSGHPSRWLPRRNV
eukprot:CAMPEP_0204250284 /NCGR_PEP_ID=MMETSP0361-20130328/100089_1 /ASSEMBLY_ACC=CAM_ASM_000343 /TAXON_ID=268821 /ORGANISM="Scrippsiella Hangoei, Strain SHTV-5" /LENGTH=297 /DNA_ID=CAMNT_0051223553 /DNA_START=19 /DNA_END=912 /DNA_ORIENTATION=-